MTAHVIVVIGMAGGVGCSTVAAHLASGITRQHQPVLAIDFCQDNVLRLHFGMSWSKNSGFAQQLVEDIGHSLAIKPVARGLHYLPFGNLKKQVELDYLINWLQNHPYWFLEQIKNISKNMDIVIVCDCPRTQPKLWEQVLTMADQIVLVCRPDPLSFATARQYTKRFLHRAEASVSMLLNSFDSGCDLDRDILSLLRFHHPHQLAPMLIHYDESLRHALANKKTVFDFAPESQTAHEFTNLAQWSLALFRENAQEDAYV